MKNKTIVLDVAVDEVKVIKFTHRGDEYESIIANFYNEAISEIQKSFKLNLNSFRTYDVYWKR